MSDNTYYVDIRISMVKFNELIIKGLLGAGDYEAHERDVKNRKFPDDPLWVELDGKSRKAYKERKNYEREQYPIKE